MNHPVARECPAGYSVRGATIDDVTAVLGVRNASTAYDFGSDGMNEAELLAAWESSGLDLEAGTWIVTAPGGQAVGYGEAALDAGAGRVTSMVWLLPEH